MATGGSAAVLTDEHLRDIVQKDSSVRLRSELKQYQSALSAIDVDALSRSELVANVVVLRKTAGQHTSVKTFVADFVPALVDDVVQLSTPVELTAPVHIGGDTLTQLLMLIQQQSQQQITLMQQQMLTMQADTEKRIKAEREEAEKRRMQDLEIAEKHLNAEREEAEKRRKQEREESAKRAQEHNDMMQEQIRLSKEAKSEREAEAKKFENRFEKAQRVLGSAIREMPLLPGEISQYLLEVEDLFKNSNTDADLWYALLRPHLNHRARKMLSTLSAQDLNDFEKVKAAIRSEFGLISSTHKYNWDHAKRALEETPKVFATRLRVLLDAYLESKRVTSFPALCELLVFDRLKSSLTDQIRRKVFDMEVTDNAFNKDKICNLIEAHESEFGRNDGWKGKDNNKITLQ